MNYTWGEIQIQSLQKMFLNNAAITVADLPTLKTDRKYSLYLNSMPAIANEGLLRLMSVGKPLIKKYTLNYNIPDDIFDYQTYDVSTVLTEDIIFEGNASQAYYFEVDNDATILIQTYDNSTWSTVETLTHTATISGTYTTYKGLITNTTPLQVRLVFKYNGYMYNIRNVALYNINFKTAAKVFNNTRKQKFDLSTLITDFYQLMSVEYESLTAKGQYNSGCELEEDKLLVIDSSLYGNYIITYKAYPTKITSSTTDATVISMPSEMLSLLPLYIASEAYKDDNISLAVQYRNQFELGLSNLDYMQEPLEFADVNKWL